ncbi:hypothetical protein PFAG_03180 [Plasmodium falciparum Santa Lucia]|nr:hypothetical protein PFAG_03180 [Plasmodium falciparum Santa Lucia]
MCIIFFSDQKFIISFNFKHQDKYKFPINRFFMLFFIFSILFKKKYISSFLLSMLKNLNIKRKYVNQKKKK